MQLFPREIVYAVKDQHFIVILSQLCHIAAVIAAVNHRDPSVIAEQVRYEGVRERILEDQQTALAAQKILWRDL